MFKTFSSSRAKSQRKYCVDCYNIES